MSSFAMFADQFFAPASRVEQASVATPVLNGLQQASMQHALAALAAHLAMVDGAPNKQEILAYQALFAADAAEAARLRGMFVKHTQEKGSALQYAREIAQLTNDAATRRDALTRLMQVAACDGMLNAAEIEWLRAVANVFGIAGEDFRTLLQGQMVPVKDSPYAVLGVSPQASDDVIRATYMARVQMLHPDKYQAAGASADTIAMLSDQLAALNAAYEAVKKRRAKKYGFAAAWRKTTKSAKAAA